MWVHRGYQQAVTSWEGDMQLCRGLSTRGNGALNLQNPVPRGPGNVLRSIPLKVNASQRNPVTITPSNALAPPTTWEHRPLPLQELIKEEDGTLLYPLSPLTRPFLSPQNGPYRP
jgi:hypothetical protein